MNSAEGGVASPLCDTPTRRSDEGGRVSCRVLCMYTTASCGGWGAKLLDNRQENALNNYLIVEWKVSLKNLKKVP